jgi:hypothetical protein
MMNEILHANIFFLIASIATICFCILVCILLFHVIKIARQVSSILDRIEAGSEIIAKDVTKIRSLILEGGIFSRLIGLFVGRKASQSRAKRRRSSEEENDEI